VSSGLEHRDCAESLAAYALGALPDAEAMRVRHHLDGCRECRTELEWLTRAVDALPASVPQVDPPPELRARVMEIVEAEAAVLQSAGPAAERPVPERDRARRPREGRRGPLRWIMTGALRPALAVAAAGVVAAVLVVTTSGGGARTIRAQIAGPALAAHASASLRVTGSRATLVVEGLPVPAANHVDELWVQRGSAAPEPAGTFVVRSGTVEVERAVLPDDVVLVTVERGRGTVAPTTKPLIVARA
jgi:anti-sigma factor RsiW